MPKKVIYRCGKTIYIIESGSELHGRFRKKEYELIKGKEANKYVSPKDLDGEYVTTPRPYWKEIVYTMVSLPLCLLMIIAWPLVFPLSLWSAKK